MWLCIEAHEFSHYTAIIVQGGKFYASLDMWWLVKGSLNDVQSLIAWAAGPLMTFTLIWTGLFMILKFEKYELVGFSLIFANLPLARVNPIGVTAIGSDERNVAELLGVSPFLILLLNLLITLPSLIVAYKSITNKRRLLWFLFFLLVMPTFLEEIGFLLPGQFLNLIIKESYDAGVPLTPMISGIPIVIIVADLTVVLLFFGKYVKYLLGSTRR
jgi:hypothetical protein